MESVLPIRKRAEITRKILRTRLETIMPMAMTEAGFDMWIIICQEDDLDPVFKTLIPMDTWCPILQIMIFHQGEPETEVRRINLSMTKTFDLYETPWVGTDQDEQWPYLLRIIEELDPKKIGINIGEIQWAAGGLTHHLYTKLLETLPPKYVDRLISAEPLVIRWLSTLIPEEIEVYDHVTKVAHQLLAECYSSAAIVPGKTTIEDLQWYYWQLSADYGLEVSFKPAFYLIRRDGMLEEHGAEDRVIRPGDFVRSDVGVKYLNLTSDHQQWVYVRQPGETTAPQGFIRLMAEGNRLQDLFMSEFRAGLTGNELLRNILARAVEEGIPNPKIYSHSLGLFLHEPGPLIGLPWEQERCVGRGDVRLENNYAFTMELSVEDTVPEWGGQLVRMALEEDVVFTAKGCHLLDSRQTGYYLV